MNIECLNPAYDRIKNSEVYNKIVDKEEDIHRIFLYNSPYAEQGWKILEKARNFYFNKDRGISEKSKVFEDIVMLEREIEDKDYYNPMHFEKVLIKHPCFLAYVVFGENIFNYKKFNFPSVKSLSESVTSFCVGENSFGEEYVWRLKGFKNTIHQNIHGDLYASQRNVSGKASLEKTLFGDDEETFDIYSEVWSSGISAYQDWTQFLIASLKYAEYLGKEKMREITNWKEVLEEAGGGVGTASAEAEFGTHFSDHDLKFLMNYPVLQEGEKVKQFPLTIFSQGENSFYPYFSERKLFYLRKNETEDISMEEFSHVYKNKKFSKVLEYSEGDLPHILTATYKYFARDRSKMHKIMDYFNSKNK